MRLQRITFKAHRYISLNPREITATGSPALRGLKFGKTLATFVMAIHIGAFSLFAQNAIVTENALPGNPSSEWDIAGAGDLTLQGFATDISVNKGQTVHFKIKTDANAYTITVYRLGYYQGNGARKVGTGVITATLPQIQPADLYDAATGKTDCSNWAESAHWDVPANAVSGIYIARLLRSNGGASHIIFIVRDDASHSDLYYQTADATWQAYNNYGGNSLYVNQSGTPVPGFNHATKVSYNRPFLTRNGGGGGGAMEDGVFNAEFPMIRWIERNGFDITYSSAVDGDRFGNLILNHKVFLNAGHDEYWSGAERANVEAARAAGKHLAFFSGNEVYWKTRYEDSYRTLVCYKEGTLGENVCGSKCDPLSPSIWTGLWRDGCAPTYAANDGCRPENALSGQISWGSSQTSIQVPDTYKNMRFWRNTSIASLGAGQTATLPDGTLGYEWDGFEQTYSGSYPAGRIKLSSTLSAGKTHNLSLYRSSAGGLVFGAGTVQWSWGLDSAHDRGNTSPSKDMQQATLNLFADMGVQPGSKQSDLIAATQSADVTPPVSIISSPANGTVVPANSTVVISGTASDANTVAGVEVSVDGGLTWHVATGTTSWTYIWATGSAGTVNIKCRGFDDSGNMESVATATNSITVTVSASAPVTCPCTIFTPNLVPDVPLSNDNTNGIAGIVVGVKFKPTQNGYITGLRYYRGEGNTGTHIGNLWTGAGTLLAQATFTNETASGWQEITLGTPIAVTSGTTYVASYNSSNGFYSNTDNFFGSSYLNTPLRALADGEEGPNGVYEYSNTPVFPTRPAVKTNYWMDVVFNSSVPPDNTPPTVVSTSPTANQAGVDLNARVTIQFNKEIDPSTVNSKTILLEDDFNNILQASVVYNPIYFTAVLTPFTTLSYSGTYKIVVKGGTGYDRIKDIAGNALAADYSFNFSTATPPPPPADEGPGGPILVISSNVNPYSRYTVELLKAQGYNEYRAVDISSVNASVLNNYDVVIVGDIPLSAGNVADLTAWTNAGGTLISFKPDAQLASLLGITPVAGTLANGYLLVNTSSGPGVGIVGQTIQYHGNANLYTLNGATSLATLYSNSASPTSNPAVTIRKVGSNGGSAIAFAYDLNRSIVYTRQGIPSLSGVKRDGTTGPVRADDMYVTGWLDINKVAIPQADEQQHLLANIILKGNLHRKPLPRFWFLPKGLKAAVVMTGDDHSIGGTANTTLNRFNQYKSLSTDNSPAGVADWNAIRGTSYIYPGSPLTPAQVTQLQTDGFEIGLHLYTGCQDYTPSNWVSNWTSQYNSLTAQFPGLLPVKTNRTHCVAWSDYSSQPKNEFLKGVRFDVNYYYYPGTWLQNRPGMFTGSGMPMRFADEDGNIIDCYQAPTQLTDESGQDIAANINTLIQNAIGSSGYYGIFCANMHTDNGFATSQSGSDAIVAAAKANNIPVVSSLQMLNWLDGRNGSSFNIISWTNNQLTFTINAASGSRNMTGMLPQNCATGPFSSLTYNGSPVTTTTQTIKGLPYVFFNATLGNGSYVATYTLDNTPLAITNAVAIPHGDGTATITWTTDKSADSRVDYGKVNNSLNLSSSDGNLITNHSISLSTLTLGTTYYFRVTSVDFFNNTTTVTAPPNAPLSFTMPPTPCALDQTAANFSFGTTDAGSFISLQGNGRVMLKPTLNDEFSGTALNTTLWTSALFDPAGSTTVSNGSVTVNGSHIYSNNTYGPGMSLEFVATFSSATHQNIGLASNIAFSSSPWIAIGEGNTADGNLYARASDGSQVNLGANLLGTPHLFKMVWNTPANNFSFYVDGNLVSTPSIVITSPSPMYIQISDFVAKTSGSLSVDWIRASPFITSGTFTSRIFDGGNIGNQWGVISWNGNIPSGTSLTLAGRTGNIAVPDGTWTSFTPLTNGSTTGLTGRYFQYQAAISTTDNKLTPDLQIVSIICPNGSTALPVTFTGITARKQDCNFGVSWSVENELHLSRYEVEASNDGRIYFQVGEVAAQQLTSYSLVFPPNPQLTAPTVFVRVKSVDLDGKYQYSKSVAVSGVCRQKGAWQLQVYPTPVSANNTVTIATKEGSFSGRYKLTLMDYSGRVYQVTEMQLDNMQKFIYRFNKLPAHGKYLVNIYNVNGSESGVVEMVVL
jgi:hypothetical protein